MIVIARTLRVAAQSREIRTGIVCLLCGLALFAAGCAAPIPVANRMAACDPSVPREHNQCSLSTYRVMPPDILQIEAIYNIRQSLIRLRPGDQITVRVLKGLPLDIGAEQRDLLTLQSKQPELQAKLINGPYTIGPDGAIDLGPAYGKIPVEGMTVTEAKGAIDQYLRTKLGLREPQVSVVLTDLTGRQVISGQHLVRPDGTVGLGIYGQVHVAGMTLVEIRQSLEMHLSQFLVEPVVSVDVLADTANRSCVCRAPATKQSSMPSQKSTDCPKFPRSEFGSRDRAPKTCASRKSSRSTGRPSRPTELRPPTIN